MTQDMVVYNQPRGWMAGLYVRSWVLIRTVLSHRVKSERGVPCFSWVSVAIAWVMDDENDRETEEKKKNE